MTSPQKEKAHWLDRYATAYHAWTSSTDSSGQTTFKRPLGLVELSFDADGVYYGGRADMTGTLTCEVQHSLSQKDLRRRIALAWTALRLRHVLLMSRHDDDADTGVRRFAIEVPRSAEDAVRDVEDSIVWVEDHYPTVDAHAFHDHALNVSRIIEPHKCMSRLHVLPLRRTAAGTFQLPLLIIMAHQISDGLSAYAWFKDLLRLLNQSASAISSEISAALDPHAFATRLPPAQEDLYPAVPGSRARQRWIWAILRVLRHVKRPLPDSFANPLYRAERLETPRPLEPVFAKIFAYDGAHMPPMSSAHISATLSASASARLVALCRESRLSIGAGCFALAGLAMMDIYSSSSPSSSIPAMSASFPLNPRAFFANPPPADSCMLAFSDGITMPFLPPHLPIEPRFRLAARAANRELRAYQKRVHAPPGVAGLDRHSPPRLLATGYLALIERVASKLPVERRRDMGMEESPQGELVAGARGGGGLATCGVSSTGSLKAYFRPGEYDLSASSSSSSATTSGTKDLVADYRGLRLGVRAREGEFLVGSSTDAEGRVGFGVSYDASAIDPEMAALWVETITGLLERGAGGKL